MSVDRDDETGEGKKEEKETCVGEIKVEQTAAQIEGSGLL